MTTGKRHTLTK